MSTTLAPLFTGESAIALTGVLDEIVALLPVVIPVAIGFIAIRKGYAFLMNALHSA